MTEQRTQHTHENDMKGFPSDRESNPVILRARIMAAVARLKTIIEQHPDADCFDKELGEVVYLLSADDKDKRMHGRCSICGSWNPDHEVGGHACNLLSKV